MAQVLWSQDVFTKGEISPLMYARVSVAPYYNGLKTATNVITFPQGAAGKRFGTIFQNFIPIVTDANQIYFEAMQYLNECVYQICFIPNNVLIYLEGVLIQTVATFIGANEIRSINHTVLDNIFRVCTGFIPPQDLQRSPDPSLIVIYDTASSVVVNPPFYYTAGLILPVRFSFTPGVGNRLPLTNPQLLEQRTYFLKFSTNITSQIYLTAPDAKANRNPIQILDTGVGTQIATTLNTWSIANTVISTYPVFDFQQIDYSGVTFTPGALTGFGVALDCSSAAIFTNANVGGTFSSETGGLARIIGFNTASQARIDIIEPFSATAAIPGYLCLLTEPVWSNTRGWPRVCSSFQNRAFFANTDLLPNGLWGSVTNDYRNFDDSQLFSDNAISWYPTSDDINFIRFIVPYRSLTVHTNSGVFSTPLSVEQAITPTNFSLTIQDSTPAEAVQPRGIDNQIVIISGNDAHSLLWDGFNNAYQANIISVANEHLIRNPTDEAAYVDLTRAGSRYMLIVNEDGTLAIYQTLISEDVQGFTPATLEQSYGNAYFRWVTTNFDGRGWFVTERQLAQPGAEIPITTFTQFTLGSAISFSLLNGQVFNLLDGNPFNLLQNDFIADEPVFAFQFQNTGTLPTSLPQVMINTWYWGVPTDSLDIAVYLTIEDARAGTNPIEFLNAGTNAIIIPWLLKTFFMIEELSFDAKVDCAVNYLGPPAFQFGAGIFNAQEIKLVGDGFGFEDIPINSLTHTIAHGNLVLVSQAQYGFPINVTIEPLPLSVFQGSTKQSQLVTPSHIRDVTLMLSDTIGGFINGVPIALANFADVPIGRPPVPVNGIFEYGIMAGWDDYKDIGFTITHSDPFDFKLIGLFYKVDL